MTTSDTAVGPSARLRLRAWWRALNKGSVAVGVVIALGAGLLVALYGLTPGFVRSFQGELQLLGRIECGADSLASLARFTCPLVGGDAGGVFQSNATVVILAVALVRIGVDAVWATAAIFYFAAVVGVWGAYRVIRGLDVARPIAVGAAILFLASTTMMGLLGFGGLVVGLLLAFGAVGAELVALEAIRGGSARRAILAGIAFTFATIAVVFSDGYAFMMLFLLSSAVGVTWALVHVRSARTAIAAGAYVVAFGVAYGLFSLVPRAGQWTHSDIGLFRSMSLDPATLFIPSRGLWWAEPLDLTVRSDLLWGDGTNSAFNYLGFGALAFAILGIVLRGRGRHPLAIGLIAVLVVALVLALGPSLKWYAVRGELAVPVTYQSYLMPVDAALFDLPTKWLYEHAPGLEFMRATYRWVVLVRFAVITFAAVGVGVLWRRNRWVAAVAALLIVAELGVNVPRELADGAIRAGWQEEFDEDVTRPLGEDLARGTHVLFSPNAVGGNDFLANYLAPTLDVWTYNVGNDKALERARSAWPEPVAQLLAADDDPMTSEALDLAAEVLGENVDVIVVPFFDLRWSSYTWPAAEQYVERGVAAAAAYAADPRFTVEYRDNYALVTLD